jgi:hypothetical protein
VSIRGGVVTSYRRVLSVHTSGIWMEISRTVFDLLTTLTTRILFSHLLPCSHMLMFSDIIGFHSFDHARHFLTACKVRF